MAFRFRRLGEISRLLPRFFFISGIPNQQFRGMLHSSFANPLSSIWVKANASIIERGCHVHRCSTVTEATHESFPEVDFLTFIESTLDELEGPHHRWLNGTVESQGSFSRDGIFLVFVGGFLEDPLMFGCDRMLMFERVKLLQQRYPRLHVFGFQSSRSVSCVAAETRVIQTVMKEYIMFPILLSNNDFTEMKNGACCLLFKGFRSPLLYHKKDVDLGMITKVIASGGRSGRSRTGSTPSTRDETQTASTSHATLQASDPSVEHTSGIASSLTNRRGRGPTRGLVLKRLTREGRVTVEFPQDCLRPVGVNAKLFTSEVGVLCRSLILATTPRWTDVTDDVRQLIRQRLQDKFVLDLSVPYISHAVDDMVRERFKEYRGELHQRYKRCRTHDEAVLFAPPHVTIDDWRILCERYSSEAFQKRSRINSANRKKLQVNHVAGSKSFVRYCYDMRDSITGQEPGPVDLYKGTHCRQATKTWVHPRASEHWAAMDTIRSQPTPDGNQRSEPDILTEVLGTRSGYVRGLGHGAKLMAPARAASNRFVTGESVLHRADFAERGSAATGRHR